MPLHFAYGSNMSVAAMARLCPASRCLGTGRLARHRLQIMQEGWLTVVPDARGVVQGLLWDVALSDMAALDRYEEVARGLYAKRHLGVLTGAGPRRAIVYVGSDAGPGMAEVAYGRAIVAAAEEAGLAESYLASLRRLLGQPASETETAGPVVRPLRATPFDRPPAQPRWRWEP